MKVGEQEMYSSFLDKGEEGVHEADCLQEERS